MSLLNMALVCIRVGLGTISSHFLLASVGLGNPFWPLICSLPCRHDLWSVDVKYYQTHCRAAICSREFDLCKYQTSSDSHLIVIHKNIMFLCLASMMWETLWPTFDQGHFLSTSAHYLGRWSRDSFMVPWSLHASMAGFSHSTWGFHHWPPIEWFYGCSMPARLFTCRRLYLYYLEGHCHYWWFLLRLLIAFIIGW